MALSRFYTEDQTFSLFQSSWSSQINPFLANPSNKCLLIKNISLISGTTIINHLLGRQMQGWRIADINGVANIYRSQPFNNLTLTLVSSAAVTVNLEVF